ncbi:MAG TPA: ABC transporter substrate-binding protein [Stellaceae bacterium]|nr:ABC transporter substrate-binding protein [Stellaceae bacterium]
MTTNDAMNRSRAPAFRCARLPRWTFAIGLAAAVIGSRPASATEHIKVGVLLTAGSGPIFVAKEKKYFDAEGLDVEFVTFDAGQPVAVATVAGDIDFGTAGVTSALYTLAAEGQLRIIAGSTMDVPGFPAGGIVVSNQAYAAGLDSLEKLAGHSTALTQVGSTYHYAFAMVAAKNGVDIKTMRTMPLQSLANDAAAVVGGQADTTMLTSTIILPLVKSNRMKLLAWAGEQVRWQVALIWTSAKTANERPAMIKHFLSAVRRGAHEVAKAFVGPDGKKFNGPNADEIAAIVAKYVHLSPEQTKVAMGYTDPDLRIDEQDVARQIAWYRSQGMIKGDFGVDRVVDKRYAVPLPVK